MVMMMIGGYVTYVLGCLIASFLGFFVLFNFRRQVVKKSKSSDIKTTPVNGHRRTVKDDESTDIIIVGAGVAGAALAYTLGKVYIYYFLLSI